MVETRSSSSGKGLLMPIPPLSSPPPRSRRKRPAATKQQRRARTKSEVETTSAAAAFPLPRVDLERTTPADIQVSFRSFPYYLCELTKHELCLSAYVHLVCKKKFPADKVSSLSQFLLLHGQPGSEIYQETLAKALAKEFDAGFIKYDPLLPMSDNNNLARTRATFAAAMAAAMSQLVKVVSEERKRGPSILFLSNTFLRDIENCMASISCSSDTADELKGKFDLIPEGVLVIGSYLDDKEEIKSLLTRYFPTNITVTMPQDQALGWKHKLDGGAPHAGINIERIRSTLDSVGWTCSDLETISIKDEVLTNESVDRIVGFAISHHLKNKGLSEDAEASLSGESIKHGFSLLEARRRVAESLRKSLKDVVIENDYEQRLLVDVIPPHELGVTFDDVGALDNVKDVLRESVMLPLQRPELFSKGQLTKPCKGILLFGPPGTGKTMLAKAVATEAGANFINVSMSSITSTFYGEAEKYAKAVFTLASKIAPSIIFIDEVDSMLSWRGTYGEHEVSRRLKNEIMMNWDGLRTKDTERVLVLAATNRPFDLDEAVVRRFPRRLMVGLPDSSNREKILRVILSKEELAPDVDLLAVASMAGGFSGSDLKDLCVLAAHRPVREILEKEKKERSSASANDASSLTALHFGDDVRPLIMDDFRHAIKHVGASTSASHTMSKLLEWNNMYGETGLREKEVLTYFL